MQWNAAENWCFLLIGWRASPQNAISHFFVFREKREKPFLDLLRFADKRILTGLFLMKVVRFASNWQAHRVPCWKYYKNHYLNRRSENLTSYFILWKPFFDLLRFRQTNFYRAISDDSSAFLAKLSSSSCSPLKVPSEPMSNSIFTKNDLLRFAVKLLI